jgi:hypothetical protein
MQLLLLHKALPINFRGSLMGLLSFTCLPVLLHLLLLLDAPLCFTSPHAEIPAASCLATEVIAKAAGSSSSGTIIPDMRLCLWDPRKSPSLVLLFRICYFNYCCPRRC